MDITLVRSMRNYIKISAKGTNSKMPEEVVSLAGVEEVVEIAVEVIGEAEEIEVEEEDVVAPKETPLTISKKRISSPPKRSQFKAKKAWQT